MRPTEQGRPDAVLSPERIPSVAPSRAPNIKGRNHFVSGMFSSSARGQRRPHAETLAVERWLALHCATVVQPFLAGSDERRGRAALARLVISIERR